MNQGLSQEAPSRLVVWVAILVLFAGVIAAGWYGLYRAHIVPSPIAFFRNNTEPQLIDDAVDAHLRGDYATARTEYAKALAEAQTPAQQGRLYARLALLDIQTGEIEKGLSALRILSASTTLPNDVRAQISMSALQVFAQNTSDTTREALFADDWEELFPANKSLTAQNVSDALAAGYERTIELHDMFYPHFMLSQFYAASAWRETGVRRNTDVIKALDHLLSGENLMRDLTTWAYWSPQNLGLMQIEDAKALASVLPFVEEKVVVEPRLTREVVRRAYERAIRYLRTSEDSNIVGAKPYRLIGQLEYGLYLAAIDDVPGAQAQVSLVLADLPSLNLSEQAAFKGQLRSLRLRADEKWYSKEPLRMAAIRLAEEDTAFKEFLLTEVGEWDTNDI